MTATTTRGRPATPAADAAPRAGAGAAGLWLACMAAMAAGLWIDTLRTPAALLASECAAPASLAEMAWRHASLMPASSIAMLAAALAPWPRAPALGARLACAVSMSVGMLAGAQLGMLAALPLGVAPFAGMVAGMAAGMAVALPAVGSP
ncbi:hypothetical protein [Achromobacter sp. RTa]|uniref:hypothetical protein n=1 Tax=Achromobacter sp. RTa TaxID=1532557 RepID=UPI001E6295C2|nr:hypothetical protein [Achromobacter sp. RTa]